ncbi:MAG: nicotinate-nucleotide adenylyltransferase [Syntrophobacterales bacterium]|jgi:nicotinate-nucleotide adenylyltransferase|nr:nicotinate-nucleotide adenylyltransferase [Syntrophobacterales bacterium]
MKWGILGGAFDPIHAGHLRSAEEIRELFGLERILFIPGHIPPHKSFAQVTSFAHREQMVRLAIKDNPLFFFSDAEKDPHVMSYSVETLASLRKQYGSDLELYFIIGQDAFQAITSWKEWERVFTMCHFVVMSRPAYETMDLRGILPPSFARSFSYDEEEQAFYGPADKAVYFRNVSPLDISSSNIRTRIREGKSIRYLVTEAVRAYIAENSLYI